MLDRAAHIAKEYFGIEGTVKALAGYEDLNFRITDADGTNYLLKCTTNPEFSHFLIAQNKVLESLAEQAHPNRFPKALTALNGKQLVAITNEDGSIYNVRMLTFLEGEFLAHVEHTDELLYEFGAFLGDLDAILVHEEHETFKWHTHEWDSKEFLQLEKYIDAMDDVEQRRVIGYYFQQFKDVVQPQLHELRTSLIHSDPNDQNVLVQNGKISGLIDFGDMVRCPVVCEVSIAVAYTLLHKEEPLAVAQKIVAGYHSKFPLEEREIALIYYFSMVRSCTTVMMAAYSQKLNPENEYISIHSDAAWKLLQQWIQIGPRKAENAFREACGLTPHPKVNKEEVTEARFKHISKALSLSYNDPIYMEQSALQYMYDDEGNAYLDCVNNIMHVGHCHPTVVKRAQAQISKMNTNTRYFYNQLNDYAAKLAAKFPAPLNKIFFVNSGSAASDLAIRLARTHTKRFDIAVVDHAYHGNTSTAIDLSPYKYQGKGGAGKAKYIHKAPIPDTYRGPYKADNPDAGKLYAAEVDKLIADVESQEKQLAAFICESIVGCGGQVTLPDGYLNNVYESVRAKGGLCIADEVQTGFGRMGSTFWGFELQGVVPDIVVMGKPMGNGHPIAAVITTDEIAASFENGMEFFSSFGGNPVSCEVGSAVLDVIEEEQLQAHALSLGNQLIAGFNDLAHKFPCIGDVRGSGLFLGIELVDDRETLEPATALAKSIVNDMKDKFIMLSTDGPHNNVIKFKPPMCFSQGNAHALLHEFEVSLEKFKEVHV